MKTLPKTPAARFRRAAKTLAELGIKAELVRSCCRSCARYGATGTLLATEMDGKLNPPSGWYKSGTAEFRDWLNWDDSLLDYLKDVVAVLNENGLAATVPASTHLAIEVRFAETPADSTCDRCGENDLQEDGRCSTCDRDDELLDN